MKGGIIVPYVVHPHHRSLDHASKKSQWIISVQDETVCYVNAVQEGWLANDSYWGLHIKDVDPIVLGSAPTQTKLFIAKFVSNNDDWHGYPVAHWLSPFDKPAMSILQAWENAGYINRAAKAKIHRGKKWNP